jgi:putative peptide zinc metalloprotease protein
MSAAALAGMGGPPPARLPRLREDLSVLAGPRDGHGRPTHRIYDALRHRYVAIDRATFVILSLWPVQQTVPTLATAASTALETEVPPQQIEELTKFLAAHDLLDRQGDEWRTQAANAAKRKRGTIMGLVHAYLYLKLPLFSPEPMLRFLAPISGMFFARWFIVAIALIGLTGLYLASRQWEVFLADARALATPSGLALFGITLFGVKIFHEAGHAIAAHRYGCRVPVAGIAVIMMAPLLYVDVTDSWRLTDRRRRMIIDAAGVIAELYVAALATFLWAFLPDGPARAVAFLIATTSLAMTLAINLNPFMRFDGYFILADLLRLDNLQERSFAVGQWQMREVLFGLNTPAPEPLSRRSRIGLAAFAYGVWFYRLTMFLGIALALYLYFFKILGIMALLFEVVAFIAKPISKELQHWWSLRMRLLASPRTYVTAAILGLGAAFIAVPWSATLRVPAVMEAAEVARVAAPAPARIVSVAVAPGASVRAGDTLMVLANDDVAFERRTLAARIGALQTQLSRQSATEIDRTERLTNEQALASLQKQREGLDRLDQQLVLTASIDGIISDFAPGLSPGRWVARGDALMLLRGPARATVAGYAAEADLARIEPGAVGRFIPELPMAAAIPVTLRTLAPESAAALDIAELAEPNGGPIVVDSTATLAPHTPRYRAGFAVSASVAAPAMRMRGTVHVEGRAESFLAAMVRQVLKVLVRESGV